MADAKKCDRCGRYYDENKNTHGSRSSTITYIRLVDINNQCYPSDEFDLCDCCVSDLVRFMIRGGKDD